MTPRRKPKPGNGAAPTTIRCAIYTRKSTERGLEQDFNSLDAQREAGEAYVASQKHEGWVCLPDRYDDGGFSGATTDRPALQRLLADAEAGVVNAIVVYKIDRFSRSIADFIRIMERLEEHQVAFVSVTQQFNTATSTGRLFTNILLSFAQFERETISERTKDKMSAARRKGKWVGGNPILGYDVAPGGGRIVVNPAEANQVREIFGLYLKTNSTVETLRELARRGCTRKRWVTRGGQERGGEPFDKPRLLYLLKNPTYIGKVCYDGVLYPGEHDAIVDQEIWDRVQAVIQRNGATAGGAHRNRNGALLKGILRCAPCDRAMIHAWSGKNGTRYQYYVCSRAQKEGWTACPTKSVPAVEIERFVVEQLRAIGSDPALAARVLAETRTVAEARAAGLRKDLASIRREAGRLARAIQRLLERKGRGSGAGGRLAEIQDQIRAADERGRIIEAEIAAFEVGRVEESELIAALERFTRVWDSLTPSEQARAIELLVERVAYDGAGERVSLTFRPSVIRALAEGGA